MADGAQVSILKKSLLLEFQLGEVFANLAKGRLVHVSKTEKTLFVTIGERNIVEARVVPLQGACRGHKMGEGRGKGRIYQSSAISKLTPSLFFPSFSLELTRKIADGEYTQRKRMANETVH